MLSSIESIRHSKSVDVSWLSKAPLPKISFPLSILWESCKDLPSANNPKLTNVPYWSVKQVAERLHWYNTWLKLPIKNCSYTTCPAALTSLILSVASNPSTAESCLSNFSTLLLKSLSMKFPVHKRIKPTSTVSSLTMNKENFKSYWKAWFSPFLKLRDNLQKRLRKISKPGMKCIEDFLIFSLILIKSTAILSSLSWRAILSLLSKTEIGSLLMKSTSLLMMCSKR